MHRFLRSFSLVSAAATFAGTLFVAYLALIAVVMSYAAHTVEFSQSERSDEASVAALESQYLAAVEAVTHADYVALGYAKPTITRYVPAAPATALR